MVLLPPAGKSIDCDSAALLGELPSLDCPYCTKPPVQFLLVAASELARNYEDSPAVAQKLASRIPDKAPGAPSPLKTGDTYEDMKVRNDRENSAPLRGRSPRASLR